MKKQLLHPLQQLWQDRSLFFVSLGLVIILLAYTLYVAFSLSPTELQIATHYTAYGETQFYRNKWYYLLTFIVFGVLITIAHIGLMIKLSQRHMRPLAVGLGALSLILLAILFFITRSVLGIAYLS